MKEITASDAKAMLEDVFLKLDGLVGASAALSDAIFYGHSPMAEYSSAATLIGGVLREQCEVINEICGRLH